MLGKTCSLSFGGVCICILTAQFTELCSCKFWSLLYFCVALLPSHPSLEVPWLQLQRVGPCVLEGQLAVRRLAGEGLAGTGDSPCHISALLSGEQHPACCSDKCRCFLRSPFHLANTLLGHKPAVPWSPVQRHFSCSCGQSLSSLTL